ncbi:M23 family metallopeptidase [Actinoplanes sp. NPDC026619]|uniref:murein hydrolase activator EnvC family protein n=1 Tax=Actinoplanes sp. NPDC026619 TaxID=3155798 RepID=UPI0033C39926
MPLTLLLLLFLWPVQPAQVVRRFDPPPQRWLAGHRGVDLGAQPGAVVRSAGAGRVSFVGSPGGVGTVTVSHAGGLRTTYQPLSPTVALGDDITAGDQLGLLTAGREDCPAAACLHWGLLRGDAYLDPLALLGLGQVRLMPLAQR